jgi:hypothetical protein
MVTQKQFLRIIFTFKEEGIPTLLRIKLLLLSKNMDWDVFTKV